MIRIAGIAGVAGEPRANLADRAGGGSIRRTVSKPTNDTARNERLVVFGCGYLGREVANEGLKRGMSVLALTRNPSTASALESRGITAVVADLATESWHDHFIGRFDYVVNCVSAGGGGIDGYRRSYVEGAQSIIGWARKNRQIGTLVYTSSTSVYEQGGGQVVDESAATLGGNERSRLLLEAEAMLRQGREGFARWFILRLAGIYGPGRHSLIEQVRTGVVSGAPGHHLNLVHRDDACAAVWAALDAPPVVADQVYNVADNAAATKGEIVEWLAKTLAVAAPSFSGSAGSERRAGAPDRIIQNRRLRSDLGWVPAFPTYREGYSRILSR